MRNVILSMHISLDGFIAGPNGELDWTRADAEVDSVMPELLERVDTALLGRGLYQGFAGYWPFYPLTDPTKAQGEVAFAKWINQAPKLVFSTKQEPLTWHNASMVQVSDPATLVAEVTRLKQQPGQHLWLFGGVRLAQTFAQLDLIDEYRLLIQPQVLGQGKPLFTALQQSRKLQLVHKKHFKIGAVMLCYQVER